MKVEIWSDVMCPFCYIGKRKLEVALQQIDFLDSVEIVWKSYQLNPELETHPNSSIYHYLSEQKGMPMEQVRTMISRVSEMAKEVGITMNFEQQVVANSFLAHRLSHLAKKWNVQHACEEALFLAHFTEGKNIDSEEVIQEIVGSNITLIDTGAAVAKQLKHKLEERGLLNQNTEKAPSNQQAQVHFWTNSEAENAEQVTEKLWGHHVHEHRL